MFHEFGKFKIAYKYPRESQSLRVSDLLKANNVSFSFLSNNYNPLGWKALNCPPTDWRRPNYIDLYNNVIKKICRENNVTYIDNNAEVSGVAWDSASDWCHYDKKVMKAIVINSYLKTFN
jgi:hypothetical protein